MGKRGGCGVCVRGVGVRCVSKWGCACGVGKRGECGVRVRGMRAAYR